MTPVFPVFRVGDRSFSSEQVVFCAEFCGWTAPVRATTESGLASARYAQEERFELGEADLQELCDDFRYRHDLLTAEETDAWLGRWQVTVEQLADHQGRRHWRERFTPDLARIVEDFRPQPQEVADALWPAIVFDGWFPRWTIELARRAAAAAAHDGKQPPADAIRQVRDEFLGRIGGPREEAAWKLLSGCPDPWLEELQSLEAWLRIERRACLDSLDLDRLLQTGRARLTRAALECAIFPSQAAAREAVQCLARDGEDLAAVAARAAVEARSGTWFFEDLPEPLSAVLLSAAEGEVLGPVPQEGGFWVGRITLKSEPQLADTEVRSRLEDRAADACLDGLVDRYVCWLITLD